MRLKELRQERELSQWDVAKGIKTGQSNIGRWEREEVLPTSDFIIKLADFFQVSTDYLLGRSELAAARIEGDFISVICAKTRKGFRERRRLIPITPMLARWLPGMDIAKLNVIRPDALTQAMKRLMPAHHLHELRHTFITRCQECGVPREVVSVWAGHAADNTQTSNVYTHFSPEYMLKEAQKVIYNL